MAPVFIFFQDKIRNIAMSPELHSPTVTVLSPAKLYNRNMKLYTFVCLTSYQMILLMNKTNHSTFFLLKLSYQQALKSVVYLSLFRYSPP